MSRFSHVQDSRLLGHLFASGDMKKVFDDTATLAAWLRVEAVLADVQAKLKLIPEDAMQAIADACDPEGHDICALGQEIAKAAHPLTPVIKAIEARAGEHGKYVHFGATTQDIMDTGAVLQMQDGFEVILNGLDGFLQASLKQAKRWRSLPMAGRTHGQQAVPITLGLKFALLAQDIAQHIKRLKQLHDELPVQFAGAAGTLATLGDKGAMVRAEFAKALGLRDPQQSWHTSRAIIVETVNQLAMTAATCGKFANEVVNLQRTEIGELAEGSAPGTGGSSTMPQKQNPMMAQNIVALARLMSAKPALALQAVMHEHERDMAAWTIEWAVVPESFIYAAEAVEQSALLAENLVVNESRIAENLASSGGLICAEAVMMDLADEMGRDEAHHHVAGIIAAAKAEGISFADALNKDEKVSALRTPAQIDALLDPANYLGESIAVVDRILGELE